MRSSRGGDLYPRVVPANAGTSRHCEERSDEAIHTFFAVLWIASRSLSSGAHSRDPLARNDDGESRYATWRDFQKVTTRSTVDGISRAKLTRAPSMSAGDGTRLAPSRNRISARTVAHSSPMVLLTIRIGS